VFCFGGMVSICCSCLDELNRADVPLSVIAELKKIIRYKTQEDVEKWYAYCQSVATEYVAVNGACPASIPDISSKLKLPPAWYVNKDKPWYLSFHQSWSR
jgi:hypothetical protein